MTYLAQVNSMAPQIRFNNVSTTRNTQTFTSSPEKSSLERQPETDSFVSKASNKEPLPEVGMLQAFLRRFPEDLVDEINETRTLPENIMIANYNGNYFLNWENPITNGAITGGTKTIPDHLELRNNIFGFTQVVPKDYNNIFLNDPQ